jgi:hypothetical protein
MMMIDNEFNIGEVVYLKTDPEQFPRIVTGLSVRTTIVSYELSLGECLSCHYDFEISREVTAENRRQE